MLPLSPDPHLHGPSYPIAYYVPGGGLPTSAKVIGVVGVIVGGLSVLLQLLALMAWIGLVTMLRGRVPAVAPGRDLLLQWASSAIYAVAGAVLLVGSIGCLRRAEWGRAAVLTWAVAYPAVVLVGAAVAVGYCIPKTLARSAGSRPIPSVFATWLYVSTGVGVVIRLVLPAFALAYLRGPRVRAAFGTL